MSVPNPVIPEEIADSQPWTKQTWAQEGPSTGTPVSGNGLVNGTNPYLAWQDTSVSPNRWFQLIDTGQGFICQTGTGSTYPAVWTTLWQITDVTQATIYFAITTLTFDERAMGTPGAVGAAPFAHRIFVGADTQPRYTQGTAGDMAWGPGGGTATDTFLARSGVSILQVTGRLNQTGTPTNPSDLATKTYVDTADNLRLLLTGGTLSGALTLAADPVTALGAATKQYVDSKFAGAIVTFFGAGAPNATLSAGSNFVVGNLYLDTTNLNLWVCKTAGTGTTSVWTLALDATSQNANAKFESWYTGSGAPGAGTLTAQNYSIGDRYWDSTGFNDWVCKTAGNASTSVWVQINGGGGGSTTFVGARVLLTANTAGVNAFTTISWGNTGNNPVFDTNAFWAGGSPTILTVPTGKAGYYKVYGNIVLSNSGTAGHFAIKITKNNGASEWFVGEYPIDTAAGAQVVPFAITIHLAVSDTVDVRVLCSSGNNGTLDGANSSDGTVGLSPGICTFGVELLGA